MADLGPGWIAVIGTSIGGLIAAGAGLLQGKSQERIEEKRLDHELRLAEERERAAAAQREVEARAAALAEERAVLVELGTAIRDAVASRLRGGDFQQPYADVTNVRRLAYLVDDEVLHALAHDFQAGHNDEELLSRVGYYFECQTPVSVTPPAIACRRRDLPGFTCLAVGPTASGAPERAGED